MGHQQNETFKILHGWLVGV